jgi:16S rRNA (adenine1518-N6/adenine1519-N6)-dimethyltransferase
VTAGNPGGGPVPASGPDTCAGHESPPSSGLRQISLARLAEFGISPKRDLGQNFLIDDNILGLILGQLECGADDVVLEVGAGLGVLTSALAGVAKHVHAFEVDKSLAAPLAATLKGDPKVSLHFEDVLKARLETLVPPPSLCASNLPYSVAGPFVIESLPGLPWVRRYCLMVQREVAERMAALPGTKAYGVLSVWVQLYARIVRVRPLSRSIFYPQPRVDSSLVVLDRLLGEELPPVDPTALRAVLQAAFGQRRKTLVNALSAGLKVQRGSALEAVERLDVPVGVRAERLAPEQFVVLAEQFFPPTGLDSAQSQPDPLGEKELG